jgi:hypothetical protein
VRSSGCHSRSSTPISHAVTASQRKLAEIYLIPETGGKTRTRFSEKIIGDGFCRD